MEELLKAVELDTGEFLTYSMYRVWLNLRSRVEPVPQET